MLLLRMLDKLADGPATEPSQRSISFVCDLLKSTVLVLLKIDGDTVFYGH